MTIVMALHGQYFVFSTCTAPAPHLVCLGCSILNTLKVDVDFHGHIHLLSSFLFMLSPSLSQILLSPISQFFFFLSSSQFLLILNQLHQEASVRGHVSRKFYLFDSLFEVHVPLLNEEGQCQSGGPAYSCPAVDEHL